MHCLQAFVRALDPYLHGAMLDNMTVDLSGQTALVSGGTSGINLSIAIRLATAGARVAVFGRDPARAVAVATEIRELGGEAAGLTGDIYDDGSIGPLWPKQRADMAGWAPSSQERRATSGPGRPTFRRMTFRRSSTLISLARSIWRRPGVNMPVQALALEWCKRGVRVNDFAWMNREHGRRIPAMANRECASGSRRLDPAWHSWHARRHRRGSAARAFDRRTPYYTCHSRRGWPACAEVCGGRPNATIIPY
jgi:short chain dehydrogenase